MILTDREIRIAIAMGQIEIDPEPSVEAYSSTTLDLRLAPNANVFHEEVGRGINIDPTAPGFNFNEILGTVSEKIPLEPEYNLKPNRLLLAWTEERLKLPSYSRIAARVEGKSSLARWGIGIHITAPTIHAGFEGNLQLEIVNHGPTAVVLRPGMKICQLIFETTLGTAEKGYEGQFSGQSHS